MSDHKDNINTYNATIFCYMEPQLDNSATIRKFHLSKARQTTKSLLCTSVSKLQATLVISKAQGTFRTLSKGLKIR